MATFSYLLAIGYLAVCIAVSFLSLSAFMVSQRRTVLFLSLFILSYAFEQISIFFNEYLTQNIVFLSSSFHSMEDPMIRVFTGAIMCHFIWMAFCDFFREQSKKLIYAPIVFFLVASLIILNITALDEAVRKWAFYSIRQLFFIGIIIYCIIRNEATSLDDVDRIRYRHKRIFLLLFTLLVVFIFIEDTLVMLVIDPQGALPSVTIEYFYRRNTSELILVLFIAFYSLRLSIQALRLQRNKSPETCCLIHNHQMQELLPYFAKRHNLTTREQEILAYLINGRNNSEIARALQLAIGTVKTHIHNIFKKTSSCSREELLQMFWAEQ